MPAGKSNRNRLSISWIDVSKNLDLRQRRTNENMIDGDVAFVGTDVDRKEDSQTIVIDISLRQSSEWQCDVESMVAYLQLFRYLVRWRGRSKCINLVFN